MRYAITLPLIVAALAANAQVLRIGNGGEPGTLDPHRYNLRLEETILNDLFLGLTTMNERGEIVPGSAESWTVTDDGLVWTFQLRKDAVWSDGRQLTAHDFVYGFRRLMDPETAASLAYFLYPIDNAEAVNTGNAPTTALGVRAIDDYVLEIRLSQPFPFLPERLLYPTGYPVPSHVIDEHGEQWVKPGNMVSNGAFVLADWRPQGYIELRKNDNFFDAENVALPQVRYLPMADAVAAYNGYRTGDLDLIGDFPSGEISWAEQNLAEHVNVSPLLSIMYLVFNVTAPPFDDVRVRAALSLAIDRELIAKRVLKSGEVPSAGFVPAMVAGYPSASSIPKPDLTEAKRLLGEAGYGPDRPLEITLRHVSGDEGKRVQVAIASMWRPLGVKTTLHHAPINVHFADLRQNQFQVAQAGWFGENNPEHYLELLMSDTGDVNYGRYASEAFDRAMQRAKQTADTTARLSQLYAAEAIGLRDHPVVPLYSVMIRSLVNPRIVGWHQNPRNVHGARYLSWR